MRDLRAESSILATLLNASQEAIILLDDALQISVFSAGAADMFGYVQSDVVGRRIDLLLPDTVPDRNWSSPLAHLLQQNQSARISAANFALLGRRCDGEILSLDVTVTCAVVPPDRGFMLMLRDASSSTRAEKRLRECEECFRIAFESETIAFTITELSGRLRAVNRSLCLLLGYTEAELLELSFQAITHPDDLAPNLSLARRLVDGEIDRYVLEKRYLHKQGHAVWVLVSVSIVRDSWGAPLYFVAHAMDVSSLKHAQRALEDRAAELERSNAELEHFASVASHDLQEPLRTVSSYTQLLEEHYGEQLDARAARWMSYIGEGVAQMKRQIYGLLSLARVRTDGAEFRPVDIEALVERVWAQLSENAERRELRLTHSPLPIIAADESQIEQLFQNLLSNAIRYQRLDVPLRVEIGAERRPGPHSEWEFSVTDNGVGVDASDATRIFEMFERAARGIDPTGVGIGLAVCDRIVKRHGGRIWVESTPDHGARFRFTLVDQSV
jgi:PAS domain S-box-containing protein